MHETNWDGALAAWRDALGPDYVVTDGTRLRSVETTTYQTSSQVAAILRPSCREEVQQCLRIASQYRAGVYPVSTGKNWGYGSSVPSGAVSALLDLSRMNRILDFSEELAYVTIEPGVTQSQLYAFLQQKNSRLWMDASGASPESSILGNSMERGFGHTPYGDHFVNSCGLEVILPTGVRIETGFARYSNAQTAAIYRTGLGPVLDGLFSQSNMGVVTRMTVWLMPAPEYFQAFFFSCGEDAMLPPVIDALRPLRMDGTIRSGMHIGNDYKVLNGLQQYPWAETAGKTPIPAEFMERFRSRMRVGIWNGSGALYGTRAQVAEARRLIKRALAGKVDRLQFLDDRKLGLAKRFWKVYRAFTGWDLEKTLPMLESVYNLMKGVPTEGALGTMYWRKRTPVPETIDPDRDRCGLIWYAPIVPTCGEDVKVLTTMVTKTMLEDEFEPMISLTLLTERAIACVISIAYDREVPGEDERAYACYRRLSAQATAQGFRPYRLGIHSMEEMSVRDDYDAILRKIKAALDPADILSLGHYQSESTQETELAAD